jgi:hypothetical protein
VKKRVMDLPGWVLQPGGAKSEGDRAPSPDEVFIERVLSVFEDHVLFSCRFVDRSPAEAEARSIFYDFPMLDDKSRTAIEEILVANTGKTLLSIGPIEVPSNGFSLQFSYV